MLSSFCPWRLHVCSGCCTGSLHALLVPVVGQTLRWPSHENCDQEGSDWPADRLPDDRVFFFYGWGCLASLLSLRTHICRLRQLHNHTCSLSHGGARVFEVQRSSEEFTCIHLKLFNSFSPPLTSVCLLQACLSQRATPQLKDWRNLKKSSGSFIRQVASNSTFHWLVLV